MKFRDFLLNSSRCPQFFHPLDVHGLFTENHPLMFPGDFPCGFSPFPSVKASQRKPEEVVQFIGVPGQVWSPHGPIGVGFFSRSKTTENWQNVSYHSICSGKLTSNCILWRGSDQFLYLKSVILLSFVWNQSQAMKMCALNVTTRRQWVCSKEV